MDSCRDARFAPLDRSRNWPTDKREEAKSRAVNGLIPSSDRGMMPFGKDWFASGRLRRHPQPPEDLEDLEKRDPRQSPWPQRPGQNKGRATRCSDD